jgi:hypothetical protein
MNLVGLMALLSQLMEENTYDNNIRNGQESVDNR